MNTKKKLPLFGIGPLYVVIIWLFTLLGIGLTVWSEVLHTGTIENCSMRIAFAVAGLLLIIGGILIWIYAVIVAKIHKTIQEGKLEQSGVYAIVRNPIYSAFLLFFSGILLLCCNLWLLILPVFYYIFLSILIKNTEEVWLNEKFGEEYQLYCQKVNRCIPWFPKNR